jgi:hypothetical protein
MPADRCGREFGSGLRGNLGQDSGVHTFSGMVMVEFTLPS